MARWLLVLLFCSIGAPAAAQTGRWTTAANTAEVEIAPCGERLCGTIVRVLSNRSMSDPSVELKDVPGVGTRVLIDFAEEGEGEWAGQIFNRETGKTYSCTMRLRSPAELEVHPYIGIRLIGQTQIWRRVEDGAPQG